jgi:hypothetical protein
VILTCINKGQETYPKVKQNKTKQKTFPLHPGLRTIEIQHASQTKIDKNHVFYQFFIS